MQMYNPPHPGGILKRQYLEPLALSISQFAKALGVSRAVLSDLVNEHTSLSPEMALRLSKALDTSPEFWLNLQQSYALWIASHKVDLNAVPQVYTATLTES